MTKPFDFDDPEQVRRYAEGPARFIPGYATLHRLVLQLLTERAGPKAHVLVLGAGGGLELHAFATAMPDWTFTGVDPSATMLAQAKQHLGEAASRVNWTLGYIPDAPQGPFDAATCLLTLHVLEVPDKLPALQSIRKRLKPSAPFAIVDQCFDTTEPDAEKHLDRYARYAIDSGADPADVARVRAAVAAGKTMLSPEREEALLREAGFSNVELFFAGLRWRGWIAQA